MRVIGARLIRMRLSRPTFSAVAFSFIVAACSLIPLTNATNADAQQKAEYIRPGAVPFPEENQFSADKERLGKLLFFDPRLSGLDYISCASCHNPSLAWGDGLPTGIGHGMTRLGRRTPTILNAAWTELLMWDGRFGTLEEQALGPIGADVEMNQALDVLASELDSIPGYRTLFQVAFPGGGVTLENIAKAIATYERTVVSGIAPFDQWIAGDETAISDEAKRGFNLFNGKANCVACHSGWNFTDGSFHDIGLPSDDLGRGNVVKGVDALRHAFKTPTLRNVVERAPYMHDGSLRDLAAVVRHYNEGGIQRPSLSDEMKPLDLTPKEEAALITFMRTFSSEDEPVFFPALPPYEQDASAAGISIIKPAGGGSGVDTSAPGCGALRHWTPCADN